MQVVSADEDPIQVDCEHPAVAEHWIFAGQLQEPTPMGWHEGELSGSI